MMRPRSWARIRLPVLALAALLVFGAANPHAAETGRPKKTGILLAAFGTTITGAHAAYEKIEARVKAEFPEIPVRWAYTSKKVRKKLARAGKTFDSPSLALASMKDENFTRVAVLSLHVIPGYEYHELVRAARAFSEPPKDLLEVRLTHPLLGDPQGMEAAAGALMSMAPADRAERDAVIFIGHGTHHPANAFYPAMQYHLWREDELAFVGAIQGAPSLENVMRELESAKAGKAYLLPLMTVAGDHARKDVAGDGPDSWKSRLEASGIETVAVLKGAGEYDAVIDIWIEHLRGALNSFE